MVGPATLPPSPAIAPRDDAPRDRRGGKAPMPVMRAQDRPERIRQWLIAAGCFFLSWQIVRLRMINISASDMLFLLAFLILLVRNRLNLLAMESLTALWALALSAMLGGLLIGSVFNGVPLRFANIGAQYLLGFLIIPMVLMSEDRLWLRKCLLAFVLGVTLSQLIALGAANLLTHSEAKAIFGPTVSTGNGRIGGLVADANLNGAIIGMALIALFNARHHRLVAIVPTLVIVGILLWALLATASFTAFAAAAIATIVYFLFADFGRFLRVGVPMLLAFAAYVLSGFPLPEAFSERVLGALLSGDIAQAGTFTHRAELIAEAWEMSKDTLFVGLGVDRFRVESAYGAPVHNFWLLLLTEGGLLAVTGLAALALVLLVMGFRGLTISRDDGAMILAIFWIFLIFTTAIPHMYNRLWIVPLVLAIAATFARDHAIAPHPLAQDDGLSRAPPAGARREGWPA